MGSVVTNAVAESLSDLINYGTVVGIGMSAFLMWVSLYMGRTFEELQEDGRKCGEENHGIELPMTDVPDNDEYDIKTRLEEEGQYVETIASEGRSINVSMSTLLTASDSEDESKSVQI